MTAVLTVFAGLAWVLTAITAVFVLVPTAGSEHRIWHRLKVARVRRWLTRRRSVSEPYQAEATMRIARRNLWWHLVMTALFTSQLAIAAGSPRAWWRPGALILIVPCLAYLLGSVVQRQKIAIIRSREAIGGRR